MAKITSTNIGKVNAFNELDPKVKKEAESKICKNCKHSPCPYCYAHGNISCDVVHFNKIKDTPELCCDGKCELV